MKKHDRLWVWLFEDGSSIKVGVWALGSLGLVLQTPGTLIFLPWDGHEHV
jgi:hypothetical protein